MKIYISYCHQQGDWVWDCLVPVLKAGGAEVLIDRERFEAGKAIEGQMDDLQDQADRQVLVLSPEYLGSSYCCHEMDRAIDTDPDFSSGSLIPLLRADCTLPDRIQVPNPLYVDLREDTRDEPWDVLFTACDIDLGVTGSHWLEVRDELLQHLQSERSVNLVVSGKNVAWRALIDHLTERPATRMIQVDLYSARTINRPGLLACMLSEDVGAFNLPPVPQDLGEFQRILERRTRPTRIAIIHFDNAPHRQYGRDLFTTLRYLVTEERKLVLLIQSRAPFDTLLRAEESGIFSQLIIEKVELTGKN